MKWQHAALGWVVGGWVYDVVYRSNRAARLAREYADSVGKPLLNVGAGTPSSSVRVALLGPSLVGDVNLDIRGAEPCPAPGFGWLDGPEAVCRGDAHDLSQYPDKTFGAVVATHVLEHLARPEAALAEWERVADRVFVVVPSWWAFHTWAQPGHRWFISSDLSRRSRLWSSPVPVVRPLG